MVSSTISNNNYEKYLQILISGPTLSRRKAIMALIADTDNRERILKCIAKIIRDQSDVLYNPISHNSKQKYKQRIKATIVQQAAIQTALSILGPDGLLDDAKFLHSIDKSGMLERLGHWPDHIATMKNRAIEIATLFKKRHKRRIGDIRYFCIFGLGGSAAPHAIVADIISNFQKLGIRIEVIHADTPNPDYIDGNTLVIFSSFSGDTEETINCYDIIKAKTDLILFLSKGGKLDSIAKQDDIPLIKLPSEENHPAYVLQPRESVCLQLTAILTLLAQIGLKPGTNGAFGITDLAFEKNIIPLLSKWRQEFGPDIPFKRNFAKRLAFFLLYGFDYSEGSLEGFDLWNKKVPCVLVDRNNWGIGHEVRTQLHERSKINAICYDAPEFLHNFVESIRAAAESSCAGLDDDPFVYYFIRSCDEQSRIRLRLDKTIRLVIQAKAHYAVLNSEGKDSFQRALFAIYFNAYMTTYLAILNGYDPLPVPTMSWLKEVMERIPRNGDEERKAQSTKRDLLVFNNLGT